MPNILNIFKNQQKVNQQNPRKVSNYNSIKKLINDPESSYRKFFNSKEDFFKNVIRVCDEANEFDKGNGFYEALQLKHGASDKWFIEYFVTALDDYRAVQILVSECSDIPEVRDNMYKLEKFLNEVSEFRSKNDKKMIKIIEDRRDWCEEFVKQIKPSDPNYQDLKRVKKLNGYIPSCSRVLLNDLKSKDIVFVDSIIRNAIQDYITLSGYNINVTKKPYATVNESYDSDSISYTCAIIEAFRQNEQETEYETEQVKCEVNNAPLLEVFGKRKKAKDDFYNKKHPLPPKIQKTEYDSEKTRKEVEEILDYTSKLLKKEHKDFINKGLEVNSLVYTLYNCDMWEEVDEDELAEPFTNSSEFYLITYDLWEYPKGNPRQIMADDGDHPVYEEMYIIVKELNDWLSKHYPKYSVEIDGDWDTGFICMTLK